MNFKVGYINDHDSVIEHDSREFCLNLVDCYSLTSEEIDKIFSLSIEESFISEDLKITRIS